MSRIRKKRESETGKTKRMQRIIKDGERRGVKQRGEERERERKKLR